MAVPGATPVTIPVVRPTVAIDVFTLVHVPPAIASLSVVDVPMHTFVPPLIVAGAVVTNIVVVVIQPVGSV